MELDEEQDREKREVPSREAPQCAAPPHAVSSCQNNDMAPSYKIKPLQRGILSGICFSFPLHTYYYTFSFFFFRSSACLLFSLGFRLKNKHFYAQFHDFLTMHHIHSFAQKWSLLSHVLE